MHHETSRIFYPFLSRKEVGAALFQYCLECNYVTLQYKQVMMHVQPPLTLLYLSPCQGCEKL